MERVTEKSLGRLDLTLWLGSTGALLAIVGLIAMLAANWHWVPLGAQIAVALAPLALGWLGYGWLWRRGIDSVAADEIVGVVWTGGVICSVALLGRVLQLSSDTFAFCAAVTGLLLPITWLLRSKAAWLAGVGFAFAAVWALTDLPVLTYRNEAGWQLLLLAALTAVFLPRAVAQWRKAGIDGGIGRWLVALAALCWTIHAVTLLCLWLDDCLELSEAWVVSGALLFLMAVGVVITQVERGQPAGRRSLSVFHWAALLMLMMPFVAFDGLALSTLGLGWLGWLWGIGALLLAVCVTLAATRRLSDEGVFLFLLPLFAFASALGSSSVFLMGCVVVGVAAIVHGVLVGRAFVANEGVNFTLLSAWAALAGLEVDLMAQGAFLLFGGVALIALNVALAKRKGGAGHE